MNISNQFIIKNLELIEVFIICYFIVINFFYLFLIGISFPYVVKMFKQNVYGHISKLFDSKNILLPVTILISVYNEEREIIDTVTNFLSLDIPGLEIMIINDGSSDKTMELLIKHFDLLRAPPVFPQQIKTAKLHNYYVSSNFSNLHVLDKEHSGKADSLNMGVNACRTPLFLTTDADTLIEKSSIESLLFSMISKSNALVQGGAVFILNGCRYKDGKIDDVRLPDSLIETLQVADYIRAFIFGRTGLMPFGGPLILPGAYSLYEKQIVLEVNGFNSEAIGEDMEIILRIRKHMTDNNLPHRISYELAAPAWTKVPNTLMGVCTQRARWYRGLMESLFSYPSMFFNPKYKSVGLVNYPYHLLVEFFGPIVEFIGYCVFFISLALGVVSWYYAIMFFLASIGLASILTVATTLLNFISFKRFDRFGDLFYLLGVELLEVMGFRQLIVIYKMKAFFDFILDKLFPSKEKKKRTKWR